MCIGIFASHWVLVCYENVFFPPNFGIQVILFGSSYHTEFSSLETLDPGVTFR